MARRKNRRKNNRNKRKTLSVEKLDQRILLTSAPIITFPLGEPAQHDVEENQTSVLTATAMDAEDDAVPTPLTFSLSGDDAARFDIGVNSGVLTFKTAPDFENPIDFDEDNVYDVDITVADSDLATNDDVRSIAISVTNIDEKPVITSAGGGSSASVNTPENQTAVTIVEAIDPEDGTNLSYVILAGGDGNAFSLDPVQGVLTFKVAPDAENPADANGDNVYHVTVLAADGQTPPNFDSQNISVNVSHAPEITSDEGGETASVDALENQSLATTVTATDFEDDDSTLSFAITGGADAAAFEISAAGELTFKQVPDYEKPGESNNTFEVEVTVTDSLGFTDAQTITVNVTNANEAPVITTGEGEEGIEIDVAETVTNVATIEADDVDAEETLTFSKSVGDDADLFEIDSATGELTFIAAPDFSTPTDANADNTYQVEVTVTDSGGLSSSKSVTVNVLDKPIVTSSDSFDVPEGQSTVGTMAGVDAEDDTAALVFSISGGTDGEIFELDPETNELSFAVAPSFDAEGDNTYEVEISVTDSGGLAGTQIITVTVLDYPEIMSPATVSAPATVSVPENQTAVAAVIGSDSEDGTNLTYEITGGLDADAFDISETGELSFKVAPDFENPTSDGGGNVYDVEVQVTDSDGLADSQSIQVEVTNVNDSPVIVSDDGSDIVEIVVAEGNLEVTTVSGVDEESETLSYGITGGADQDLFDVDSVTGELTFQDPPSYANPIDADGDNVYEVTVTAVDSDFPPGTDSQTVNVTVSDVPQITSDGGGDTASVDVAEHVLSVTTVIGTDAEDAALEYSITGGADADAFSIDESTGELTLITPADYEDPNDVGEDGVYEVEVTVTDSVGLLDSQMLTVTVTNELDAPVVTSGEGAESIEVDAAENQTAVTIVAATDIEDDAADPPLPLTYEVSGGADENAFGMDALTGALTFLVAPSYESPTDSDMDNVYEVEVTVRDSDGMTDEQSITVSLLDAPVITSDEGGDTAEISVAEATDFFFFVEGPFEADESTYVTTVEATDTEDGDTPLAYDITGGADMSAFTIDEESGDLYFDLLPQYEDEADADNDNIFEVEVSAIDSDGLMDTQAISVTLLDAPVITSDGGEELAFVQMPENQVSITTVVATDTEDDASPDPETGIWFEILDPEFGEYTGEAMFNIDHETGELSFNEAPDFEFPMGESVFPSIDTPGDPEYSNNYEVTVVVTDSDGMSDIQTIIVDVTDVNENPVIESDGGGNTASISVGEGQLEVTQVQAHDPEDDITGAPLTYGLAGGADVGKFNVHPLTGLLSFNAAPSFDNPTDNGTDNTYEVTVIVLDSNDVHLIDSQTITVSVTDAPVITSNGGGDTANVDAAENQTTVTTVAATDVEDDANVELDLTYSISGGADADAFSIDSETGALTFDEAPDYEDLTDDNEDGVYEVEVAVMDSDELVDVQALSISVTDVNDVPEIDSESYEIEIDEGDARVMFVPASDVEDDASEDVAIEFSVSGGPDAGDFNIDSSSGELSFKESPDYEIPADDDLDNVYEVEVTVTDSDLATDSTSITVEVSDIQEAPVITSHEGSETVEISVAEDQTNVTIISATDDEDDLSEEASLTFSIAGGADAEQFDIDPVTGELTFDPAPNHESPADDGENNTYEVIVAVTDTGDKSDSQAILVTVQDAPEITSDTGGDTATIAVDEDETEVTTVVASDVEDDADEQASVVYGLVESGDYEAFDINPATGSLVFKMAPDYENPNDADEQNDYEVVVTATDSDGQMDSQAMTVTVSDLNDLPEIVSDGGASTANVNATEGSTTATIVQATDAEDDLAEVPLSYNLLGGADINAFTIDNATGELRFKVAPTYEAPTDSDLDSKYEVQVVVVDSEGALDVQAITVTVTDGPIVTSDGGGETADINVDENQTAVTTVEATDTEDDVTETALTYDITGGADADAFALAANGELTFVVAPNFESPTDADEDGTYEIEVTVTDSDGLTVTQSLDITVTDVNDVPGITSDDGGEEGIDVSENSTAVTTVTAEDEEEGTLLTYETVGGADANAFEIDPETGELSFAEAPDYESPSDEGEDNTYEVEVGVFDSGDAMGTQTIMVNVTNVSELPEIVSDEGGDTANLTAAENQPFVTIVEAIDDENDAAEIPFDFDISGGADMDAFDIDQNGELVFLNSPDFEVPGDSDVDGTYEIEVTVTDADDNTDVQAISIDVTNVNEGPMITSDEGGETASVDVVENQVGVTTLMATDPEDGSELAFSITGGADQAAFSLEAGVLEFVAAPDFEEPEDTGEDNTYDVEVTVTDETGLTDSQAISVTVVDVNDAPVITSSAAAIVAENTTSVTTVTAEDADAESTLEISISGGVDADAFEIRETGELTFVAAPDFENPADADGDNVYEVELTVSDSGGMSDSQSFFVTVTDLDDTPSANVSVDGNVVIAVATDGDDNVELILGEENHVLTIASEVFTYDASIIDTFHIGAGAAAGIDQILVVGTGLNDTASAVENSGLISSEAYSIYTYSFDSIVFDGQGGNDYAQIYGSNAEDNLQGLPQNSTLTTPDRVFQMLGFERVDAYGRGGSDYASVYGNDGEDDFYTFNTFEVLQGDGHYQKTMGFSRVDAFGRGGSDLAHLFDTTGNDYLYAFATHVVMQSDHLLAYVKGFEEIESAANNGGIDTANLRNLTSVDTFFGSGNVASVTGPDRSITASEFDIVNVEANNGETPASDVSETDYVLSSEGDWLNLIA